MTYAKDDEDWQRLIMEKCGDRCMWPGCGSSWMAAGHHIISRRYKNLRLVLENGVCLCGKHHQQIHEATESQWMVWSKILVGPKTFLELVELQRTTLLRNDTDHSNEKPSSQDLDTLF